MKPSPKRQPAKRKLRGRHFGGVYLSARVREWCKARHLRPEFLAASVTDMFVTDNPTAPVVIHSDHPIDLAKAYDADWLKSQGL